MIPMAPTRERRARRRRRRRTGGEPYPKPSARTDSVSSSMNRQLIAREKAARACRVGSTHGLSSLPSSQVMRPMKMSLRMPATSRTTRTSTTQCLALDPRRRRAAHRDWWNLCFHLPARFRPPCSLSGN